MNGSRGTIMASKKILTDGLTNKQRILRMVERWDDDIPFEQAVYHMHVMKEVMEGIKDVEEGRVFDFDEVFDELERHGHEEDQAADVGKGQKKPGGSQGPDRESRRSKNGRVLHKPAKKIRKPTS